MIFLRVVRVILIVLGIGTAALGIILITVDARMSGGPIAASWSCKSEGTGTAARMNCKTESATYAGPGGLVDTLSFLSLTIGGVALIGAAVAIGQFDRPRTPTAPKPTPMGPPPPPPGHVPQQAPGRPW
ncbi:MULTISPECIES: hypothetical protein [unclassified Saccharothrix]|uniref:hypothetical protein n=1 Tax=unclassified Saccharothrix TaxID=2593673 RepID=UPI00307F81DB